MRGLDPGLGELADDAKQLSQYYIASRYPDDIPEDLTVEEATAAYDAASRIRMRILASVDALRKPPEPEADDVSK